MEGAGRAAGSATPIQIGKKTYLLRPLSPDAIGSLEQKWLAERGSYVETAKRHINGLPPEIAAEFLARCAARETELAHTLTPEEWNMHANSRTGLAYTLWLMAREEHPDLEYEVVLEEIVGSNQDELLRLLHARDVASGISELGNETGQDPTSTTSPSSSEPTGNEQASDSDTRSTGD